MTQAHRERGGKVSAAKQERDARGKFAGAKGSKRATQREGHSSPEESRGGSAGHHNAASSHHGGER